MCFTAWSTLRSALLLLAYNKELALRHCHICIGLKKWSRYDTRISPQTKHLFCSLRFKKKLRMPIFNEIRRMIWKKKTLPIRYVRLSCFEPQIWPSGLEWNFLGGLAWWICWGGRLEDTKSFSKLDWEYGFDEKSGCSHLQFLPKAETIRGKMNIFENRKGYLHFFYLVFLIFTFMNRQNRSRRKILRFQF